MASENRTPPRLILILGGARSGKSAFAERLAASSGRTVAFIATATASDDEMRERIARHRASRPKQWHTLEEPLDLARAVQQAYKLADVVLLDCVTLWLSNMLLQESGPGGSDDGGEKQEELRRTSNLFAERSLKQIEALLAVVQAAEPGKTLIVVTNEVGLGIVPAYPLGRVYRDTLGYVNQRLAQAADRVYLMVAGMAVDIKRLHEEASLWGLTVPLHVDYYGTRVVFPTTAPQRIVSLVPTVSEILGALQLQERVVGVEVPVAAWYYSGK